MAKPVLLLVAPEGVYRDSLAEQLAAEGDTTLVLAAREDDARAALAEQPVAMIVMDDAEDGAGMAARLRHDGIGTPLLLLGEKTESEESDDIEALPKPFRMGVLLQRISAALAPSATDAPIPIGPYAFHPTAKLLVAGEKRIRLTEKEADILKYLKAAQGIVPKQTLLGEVWGYGPQVTTHTLETHVYRLRRKIEQDPGEARILLTDDGGYRLCP